MKHCSPIPKTQGVSKAPAHIPGMEKATARNSKPETQSPVSGLVRRSRKNPATGVDPCATKGRNYKGYNRSLTVFLASVFASILRAKYAGSCSMRIKAPEIGYKYNYPIYKPYLYVPMTLQVFELPEP